MTEPEEQEGEQFTFEEARSFLDRMAEQAGEWAGIPIGFDDQHLVIDSSYPWAHVYNERRTRQETSNTAKITVVNSWYSARRRTEVVLYRDEEGKVRSQEYIAIHNLRRITDTLGASSAWSLKAEFKACEKLASLIPKHHFRDYMLTGMFLETSKRSGVTYLFRKLRPTLAMRCWPDREYALLLCALCLHPIGYYDGTWGGAMVPTDDVIAHLLLMRGDEQLFWRQANQHPCDRLEAGL